MSGTPERIVEKHVYDGEEFDVLFRKGTPGKSKEEIKAMGPGAGFENTMFCYCAPVNQREYEADMGVTCYQDVEVPMRDGVTIYADIYRPAGHTDKIPVIVSWGPFGKRPAEGQEDWKLMGVPPKTVSEMAKFECADPGYWCHQGYAVANVDSRGIGNSHGNVHMWDMQDAYDGHDFIEWAAAQEWCNGRVTLFGNSGVCMAAWKIASTQPPHLACLAAWEGCGDMYRESYFCGGIPNPDYETNIMSALACKTYLEDTPEMMKRYPFMNKYWEDKIVKWDKIRCPTYVTAGWVHHHLRGSIEGFRRIRAPKKWLRIHRDFEWPDSYNPHNLEDLRRFYDRYCKEIHNGWEFTPRVRVGVMDAYAYDYATNRPETSFPIDRTVYKKLYLNAEGQNASYDTFAKESEAVYDPNTETARFVYQFTEDTEITGFMKLHLWVECRGHDNMDLFPWVMKQDEKGEFVPIECMGAPYRGAWGFLRCSHRELSPQYASAFQPVHAHTGEERMKPGECLPVELEFYPHSRFFHKGEQLVIQLAGRFIKTDWFHDAQMNHATDNGDGLHVIHTGGQYDSYLQIPVIPPKYQVGDYTYKD